MPNLRICQTIEFHQINVHINPSLGVSTPRDFTQLGDKEVSRVGFSFSDASRVLLFRLAF